MTSVSNTGAGLPPWLPGPAVRPAEVFECVGVPRMLDQIPVVKAPGVCVERELGGIIRR